jgi:carbonic anhydrase
MVCDALGDFNINKALKKKLKATQRNRTLQYKYTGGGIVITADAASFELFKMAAIAYHYYILLEFHLQAVSEFQIKVDIFCFSYNY